MVKKTEYNFQIKMTANEITVIRNCIKFVILEALFYIPFFLAKIEEIPKCCLQKSVPSKFLETLYFEIILDSQLQNRTNNSHAPSSNFPSNILHNNCEGQ